MNRNALADSSDTSTIDAWNGSHCLFVNILNLMTMGSTDDPAWTDVHAAQEEVKRVRDNEFRAEHPHLSEWKEVSSASGRCVPLQRR